MNLLIFLNFYLPKEHIVIDGQEIPYFIAGDPAYPLQPWLMKNYAYTVGMTEEQDSFNAYLNEGRVIVEIAFGRLKGRWRRLQKTMDQKISFAPKVVAACCVLHNIIETKENSYRAEWPREARKQSTKFPQPDAIPFEQEFDANENDIESDEAKAIRNTLQNYMKLNYPLRKSLKWRCLH